MAKSRTVSQEEISDNLTHYLVRVGEEMSRQGLGRIKCGPTSQSGLKIDITVSKASEREVEKYRCKSETTRGGKKFRCTLNRRHQGRHTIRTSSGYHMYEDAT